MEHTADVSWSALDTRVYNTSVGAGEVPHDDGWLDHGSQPRAHGMRALPTLPLGMLHRNAPPILAPWRRGAAEELRKLATFDERSLVHGDQAIVWNDTVIPAAATCVAKHRIVSLEQKRTGTVATSETEFIVDGCCLCTSVASMFLRGGKLTEFGVSTAANLRAQRRTNAGVLASLKASQRVAQSKQTSEVRRIELRTAPNQAALYAINGDDNPIHVDWKVAQAAGFPSPILHGLCTFGMAVRALLRLAAEVLNLSPPAVKPVACMTRFSKPVFPGQTLILEARVASSSPADVSFQYDVVVDGVVVCRNGAATFASSRPTAKL